MPNLELTPVVREGIEGPVALAQPPGEGEKLFVVERRGTIRIIQDGTVLDEPFLDLRDRVAFSGMEAGLLGLAFHPNYGENGRFFVNYTRSTSKANGAVEELFDTVKEYYFDPDDEPWAKNIVAEYQRSETNPDRANSTEVRRLISTPSPHQNHNGGTVRFGPSGYLFASVGNGGGGVYTSDDAMGRAQNTGSVHGTILRMAVDRPGKNFAVEENPFAGTSEGDSRIFAWGLRNPWRFTFDPFTGDMFIGDVGSSEYEEIDFIPANSGGGYNFGWPAWEGDEEGPVPEARKVIDSHTPPLLEIPHGSDDSLLRGACATVGGEVYRGEAIPELKGYFVHGDFCSRDIGALRYCDADGDSDREIVDHRRLEVSVPPGLRAIATGNDGQLYFLRREGVDRLVSAPVEDD